jgi:hypothetical protein
VATRQFLRVVAFPWAMATSQDLQIPGTSGKRSRVQPLVDAYMSRLFSMGTRDGEVTQMTSRVFNLVESPLKLYAPRLAVRALREPAPRPLLGPVAPPGLSTPPLHEAPPAPTASRGAP